MIFPGWTRIIVASLLLSAVCVGAPARAAPPATEQDKAVEAVRQMFVALAHDDIELFKSVTSEDFYSFDVGKRFDGDALAQLVKKAHAAGKVYVWEVTEPEVRVEGNTALVTYINLGSIRDASGLKEMSWLESAVLRKEKDAWRIHFFHSTRVPSE